MIFYLRGKSKFFLQLSMKHDMEGYNFFSQHRQNTKVAKTLMKGAD